MIELLFIFGFIALVFFIRQLFIYHIYPYCKKYEENNK